MRSILRRQAFGRIPYRPLARIIPHQARSRPRRSHAGDVDNHASFLAIDGLLRPRVAAEIHALDVDVEGALEFFFRHVLRRLVGVAPACVVDEDVAASEFLDAG